MKTNLCVSCFLLLILKESNVIYCDSYDEDYQEDSEKRLLSSVDLPPFFEESGKIKMTLQVEDISSVNGKTMDFRVDYYLKHEWTVNSEYCEFYEKSMKAHKCDLPVNEVTIITAWKLINTLFWTPDTYLANAKKVEMPSKRIDMRMLRINRTQDECLMELITRLDATISCPMDFHAFPVDVQTCEASFLSISYDISLIKYEWQKPAIVINEAIKVLNYKYRLKTYETLRTSLKDTYSTLVVFFIFERQIYSSLISVYAPSTLIVVMAWFSFWMGLDAIPGRMTLCVTSLLALITQFSSIRSELPPVAYVNGADIWMLACMFLLFVSVLEFAVIKYIFTSSEIVAERKSTKISDLLSKKMINNDVQYNVQWLTESMSNGNTLNKRNNSLRPKFLICEQTSNAWCTNSTMKPTRNFKEISYDFLFNEQTESQWNDRTNIAYEEIRDYLSRRSHCVATIDYVFRIMYPVLFIIFNVIYWPILLL